MCHQSVGLYARYLESEGIATVVIGALKPMLETVKPPRVLWIRAALGKLVGNPHDTNEQMNRVKKALNLLETATYGGTLVSYSDKGN
ncbi:hypothetical protein [Sulfobacillus thermosulfidooxidans]|uniref:Uncharacterized protein n=1 Tax=Sulfobacillus thermosulfidooxidans TaxID=28034 RepID=A0A2T2WP71_SULTH|nr:hypothetical protein [Sulfobacillus thermosulfidooxidans]PSR24040.1 MAG: hypothetical protein C7B47_15450 [Sulfobacillus thermosulfidooxidans]